MYYYELFNGPRFFLCGYNIDRLHYCMQANLAVREAKGGMTNLAFCMTSKW